MQDFLLYIFSKIFIKIRSKIYLSITFLVSSALLSAFLDALTVIAVIISVTFSFYSIYHEVRSKDRSIIKDENIDLEEFRGFLRNILMHSGVGTALGGISTMVGEPQNLIIANKAGWDFIDFSMNMITISIPCFIVGIIICYTLEKFKIKKSKYF